MDIWSANSQRCFDTTIKSDTCFVVPYREAIGTQTRQQVLGCYHIRNHLSMRVGHPATSTVQQRLNLPTDPWRNEWKDTVWAYCFQVFAWLYKGRIYIHGECLCSRYRILIVTLYSASFSAEFWFCLHKKLCHNCWGKQFRRLELCGDFIKPSSAWFIWFV